MPTNLAINDVAADQLERYEMTLTDEHIDAIEEAESGEIEMGQWDGEPITRTRTAAERLAGVLRENHANN